MRKNDLIKYLEGIKGNPEIVLWNGFVGDFQHIDSVSEQRLVKQTLDHYLEMCRLEEAIDLKDMTHQLSRPAKEQLTDYYKTTFEYEINEYVSSEDVKSKKYQAKKVYIIDTKPRGKKTFDRRGSIKY